MTLSQPQDKEQILIALTAQFLAESRIPHKSQIQMSDSLQQHLGMDSLGRAELFRRIEKKFDVTFPDRLLAEAETLQDVLDYLKSTKTTLEGALHEPTVVAHRTILSVDVSHAQTLTEVLLRYAEEAPDKPHVYFQKEEGGEEVVTYEQLLQSARRVAASLHALGIHENETVAIMQPTHPRF